MEHSILKYAAENDYFLYLDGLDGGALLSEFYACHRLKKAITKQIDEFCRAVYNDFCSWLVDIDHEDITNYRHYLIRVLSRFEMFLNRQRRHITKLYNLYDTKPIRSINAPKNLNAFDVFGVYEEVANKMQCLENIVSAFEEIKNMSMSTARETSALYLMPKDGEICFSEEKPDDNDDSSKRALESLYSDLKWTLIKEAGWHLSDFKD